MIDFIEMIISFFSDVWVTINVTIATFGEYSIQLGDLILALLITAIIISATIRSIRV